uniref:Fibronectin type-III domain-containing protein n=1 Tax=Strigamia maritima TaxID=126957 RepID=T1JN20_STRMM
MLVGSVPVGLPGKLKPPEVLKATHTTITFQWGEFVESDSGSTSSTDAGRTGSATGSTGSGRSKSISVSGSVKSPSVRSKSTSGSSTSTLGLQGEEYSIGKSSLPTTEKQILFTLQVEHLQMERQTWNDVYRGYANKREIEDFKPNTSYKFRISASNATGAGPWSNTMIASTTPEPIYGSDIHRFVRLNDIDSLKNIVRNSRSMSIDAPDKYGRTPLMEACIKDSIPLADLLLSGGADIEASAEGGKTSLLFACFAGKLKMAEFLRTHGASMDVVDSVGSTVLHAAADGGFAEVASWALDNGVPVDRIDIRNGWTALHRTAATSGSPEVARVLLKRGADVNAIDKDGKSSLMIATCNNYQNLVEELIFYGADAKFKNAVKTD